MDPAQQIPQPVNNGDNSIVTGDKPIANPSSFQIVDQKETEDFSNMASVHTAQTLNNTIPVAQSTSKGESYDQIRKLGEKVEHAVLPEELKIILNERIARLALIRSGAGSGFTCAACLQKTKKQGLVVTGSVGAEYAPVGASGGVGPALTFSNAENAAELGGTDIYGGGSAKIFVGGQIDHGRSVDPGNLGIWNWTLNPQVGLGADLHGGINITGAFDIPGF